MLQNGKPDIEELIKEVSYQASRSGGPGGQNVNKVNTKVTLLFDIGQSVVLTEEQKQKIFRKLAHRITKDGILMISASEARSQLKNKEIAQKKFEKLIDKAFARRKTRKKTRIPKSAVKKRLENKKKHSEKKKWRQKPY